MRPGISCSASRISLRPSSASPMSWTLNGTRAGVATFRCVDVAMRNLPLSLSVPAGDGGEQRRSRRLARRQQRLHARAGEPGLPEPGSRLRRLEAEPDMSHLALVLAPVVREHVDHEEPAAPAE